MTFSPFDHMQAAVDIVNTSLHPTNKIAATVFGGGYAVSKVNYWPLAILEKFGMEQDIGNSSGTIHAEIACILSAPATEGASICVTDPFCPNCAKNIAEAGIKTIYIDHKGFDKDFASRRGDHFQNMSMQVCERAGISVYEIRRKEEKLTPILEIPQDYRPFNDSPIIVSSTPALSEADFLDLVSDSKANLAGDKFAVAIATDRDGKPFGLCAKLHLAIGYSKNVDAAELHDVHGKYTFILEPVNRILMNAARLGLKIHPDYLYASAVPTSRELVNIVGAGIKTISISNITRARDNDSLLAINQLSGAGILKTTQIK